MGVVKKFEPRDSVVSVRLSESEYELLKILALQNGGSESDYLRWLIAKEAREAGLIIPARLQYETT